MAQHGQKKRWLVALGVTLWVSFVCAGGATMLFFATFDPVEIAAVATFPMNIDRTSGYSVGFLLFWVLLIFNSCLINCLLTRDPNTDKKAPTEQG
ncbi:MAG: hypothetical protein ACI9XU_002015 [Arenicella sp.]|jgi:hypothetical protein